MKQLKSKKTIIVLSILLIGIIGITIAYFSNAVDIENIFNTKEYSNTVTEEFISPDNWLPGDETPKIIVATNTGEVDQAVRISYTEKWITDSGIELNGWVHADGSKSSHSTEEELSNDERVAIINFDNNDDWTYKDGYYYYNYRLKPNESTSSLIKSVTFNPKTKLDDTCEEVNNNGVKTIMCNSSEEGYDGATYTLTFKIETVQFNKYMNAWNTDVAILEEQALFCDYFEVGELVTYNGVDYYVLNYSSNSDDYVTLLKKEPLTAEEVNQYSIVYVSQDGEYPYYRSDTCNENNQTGCSTNYNTSDVKKIVEGWSSSFSDDLVSVDGYKVGLINDDIFNYHFEYKIISPSQEGFRLKNDDEIINHIFLSEKTYWINFKTNDSNTNIYKLGKYEPITEKIYNKSYIRPVINLKKSVINGACHYNKTEYLYCDFGEEVTYNNEKYYVLEESNNTKKYVTLLKADLLTAEEVNQYGNNYISEDGEYPYYESETCNDNNNVECSYESIGGYNRQNEYSFYYNSNIKELIDNWSRQYGSDLVGLGEYEYKARLLNTIELEDNLKYEKEFFMGYYRFNSTSSTPNWAYFDGKKYWANILLNVSNSNIEYANEVGLTSRPKNVYEHLYVRPVINLHKRAIESGCHIDNNNNNNNNKNYTTYFIGETISYNNSNYCVISNSSNKSDYVTLIKQEPLTYDELVTYNNGYEIGRDNVDNNSGTISYYKSDTCYYNSDSDSDENTSGCSNDYNNSFIKNVVNNWSNSFANDLKEVDGNKVRLIKNEELNNMGHIYYSSTPSSVIRKSSYECLYSDADYWTMSSSSDSTYTSDIVSKIDNNNGPQYIDKKYAVRPVINLKKCAIDNTCE